jgi:hypothetical protein
VGAGTPHSAPPVPRAGERRAPHRRDRRPPRPIAEQRDEVRQWARDHSRRGGELFDEERFEEAAREYETAYALVPLPQLLYNIAASDHGAGNGSLALGWYRRLADAGVEVENREELDRWMEGCEDRDPHPMPDDDEEVAECPNKESERGAPVEDDRDSGNAEARESNRHGETVPHSMPDETPEGHRVDSGFQLEPAEVDPIVLGPPEYETVDSRDRGNVAFYVLMMLTGFSMTGVGAWMIADDNIFDADLCSSDDAEELNRRSCIIGGVLLIGIGLTAAIYSMIDWVREARERSFALASERTFVLNL